MEEGIWHAFFYRKLDFVYLSLIQIKSRLVRNVMTVIREGVRAAASIQVKPFEFCVREGVWATLFMFHLSVADVSWVKLNSWHWEGRDHTAHPLLCLGTGFLLASLDPLIVYALEGCWWMTTKVGGETSSFSWVAGAKELHADLFVWLQRHKQSGN